MNRVLLPPLGDLAAQAAPAHQTHVLLISGSMTKGSHKHCLVDSVAEQLHPRATRTLSVNAMAPMIESGELTERIRRLTGELIHLSQVLGLTAYRPHPASDPK